jgi:hypothetical protein
LACVLLIFMVREPLLVVARQRWVWKTPHPETTEATKRLGWQALALAASGLLLVLVWPLWLIASLGAGAAVLTIYAVATTIHNRQRSIVFQAVSAAGLSSSCVPACWAVLGSIPEWCWWWWALHAAHFLTGILVVHTRLEARIAAKTMGSAIAANDASATRSPAATQLKAKAEAARQSFLKLRRHTSSIQWIVVAAALGLAVAGLALGGVPGGVWYAAALLISAVIHFHDLAVADHAAEIARSMTSVGKRALAVSIVFTVLLVLATL